MTKVMVYKNSQKDHIDDYISMILEFVSGYSREILMLREHRSRASDRFNVRYCDREECIKSCDFVVVLGGDGTILSIAKQAAIYKKPLIGINFGHVGFISELEIAEYKKLAEIFDGQYVKDNRMLLDIKIFRNSKKIFENHALNDIITKGNVFRIINISVLSDNNLVSQFNGDGVIISTPTGSTAYSLSAGGPVIEPASENICVTPICAHALQAKSYVFASQRTIKIKAECQSYNQVFASVDGKEGFQVLPDDEIIVTKSIHSLDLIRIKGKNFYNILREKL